MTVTISSFAGASKVGDGDFIEIATITAAVAGFVFWFEDSGSVVPFPAWNPTTGEGSFIKFVLHPGQAAETIALFPVVSGLNYIDLSKFDKDSKIEVHYDQALLKDLIVAAQRLLPPLPPLPGITPLTPPLPTLQ